MCRVRKAIFHGFFPKARVKHTRWRNLGIWESTSNNNLHLTWTSARMWKDMSNRKFIFFVVCARFFLKKEMNLFEWVFIHERYNILQSKIIGISKSSSVQFFRNSPVSLSEIWFHRSSEENRRRLGYYRFTPLDWEIKFDIIIKSLILLHEKV